LAELCKGRHTSSVVLVPHKLTTFLLIVFPTNTQFVNLQNINIRPCRARAASPEQLSHCGTVPQAVHCHREPTNVRRRRCNFKNPEISKCQLPNELLHNTAINATSAYSKHTQC